MCQSAVDCHVCVCVCVCVCVHENGKSYLLEIMMEPLWFIRLETKVDLCVWLCVRLVLDHTGSFRGRHRKSTTMFDVFVHLGVGQLVLSLARDTG